MDISALSTGAVDITVTTSKDTSQAFDAIKSFVADYNTLIEELYETVNQKHDSDYPPLTEEQREEMSETEIENWEKKAKEGLLYQDSTISRFLTTLRSSVSGFSSNGMTVANLGISVSAVITDYGKLELDETSLQKALDSNAENILKFFTDSEKGFAAGVTKAINNAVGTTGSSKGTLVILAGIANTSTAVNNSISRQLEQYQDLIDTLQSRYEDEQDRYWASFTNLETVISSYNTQSSWLTSQLSS